MSTIAIGNEATSNKSSIPLMDEILEKITDVAKISEEKEKNSEKNRNVISKKGPGASLTGEEKARYTQIGQVFSQEESKELNKLIEKERQKNAMKINGNKTAPMHNSFKKGEKNEENQEGNEDKASFLEKVMGWLALGGFVFLIFESKITDFFSKGWNLLSSIFNKIASFFNPANTASAISKILLTVVSGLNGLWNFLKVPFIALGKVGSWIWDKIKGMWTSLISGENGVLKFCLGLITGVLTFASDAVNWLGRTLLNVITGNFSAIFGSSADSASNAGKEVTKEVKAGVDEAKQQMIKENTKKENEQNLKSVLKEDSFSTLSETTQEKAFQEAHKKTTAEARNVLNNYGVKMQNDTEVSNAAIADAWATHFLEKVQQEAESGDELDKREYQKMHEKLSAEIQKNIKDNKIDLNGDEFRGKIKEMARETGEDYWDSDTLDKLQHISSSEFNSYTEGLNEKMDKIFESKAKIEASANQYKSLTEEEKFIARLKAAEEAGQGANFRLVEARKMVTDFIKAIDENLKNIDNKVWDIFNSSVRELFYGFKKIFQVHIDGSKVYDYSKREYTIVPIKKSELNSVVNELENIARENVRIISEQNLILKSIYDSLDKISLPNSQKSENKILPVPLDKQDNENNDYMSTLNNVTDLRASMVKSVTA